MCAESVNTFLSAKHLSELQVQDWLTLSHHLGLTEDEVEDIDKQQNPTAEVLRAAKVRSIDLTWKDIVKALLKIEEYAVAEKVCHVQGKTIKCTVLCT